MAKRNPGIRSLHRQDRGKPVTGNCGFPILGRVLDTARHRAELKRLLPWTPESSFLPSPLSFIKELLGTLILWILDLPASERCHHAYPYGLFDHSLEVALASMVMSIPRLEDHSNKGLLPSQHYHRALPLPGLLGLLHDVGKVFSVEVKASKGGDIWHPLRESLVDFKARHRMPILNPTPFKFRRGRGLSAHEKQGRDLLPLVIPQSLAAPLGSDLLEAYETYQSRYENPPPSGPMPFGFIADRVRRADGTSSFRSNRGSQAGEYLRELLPNKILKAQQQGFHQARPSSDSKDVVDSSERNPSGAGDGAGEGTLE